MASTMFLPLLAELRTKLGNAGVFFDEVLTELLERGKICLLVAGLIVFALDRVEEWLWITFSRGGVSDTLVISGLVGR